MKVKKAVWQLKISSCKATTSTVLEIGPRPATLHGEETKHDSRHCLSAHRQREWRISPT